MSSLKKKSDKAKVKLSSIDYNIYFENAIIEDTPIEILNLGDLNLPTGQIVACDPSLLWDATPFNRAVKRGTYPVTACIAKTQDAGDRYALVKIEFSSDRAVAWEMALIDGQDLGILKDDQFFGFGVDAGFGSVCDAQTQSCYNEWVDDLNKEDPYGNIVYNKFIDPGLEKNAEASPESAYTCNWLNFYVPTQTDLNVIMFSSGYGDGHYASYWGVNSKGDICSLLIDLQVIGYDF